MSGERVKRHTTIKVRLYPTAEQADTIDKTIDCCRYIWNEMLSDEREFYFATGQHYIPIPARYKRTAPFLKDADSQALTAVHTNLRQTFQAFFQDSEKHPYPAFKHRHNTRNTYRTYCHHYGGGTPDSIRIEGDGIVLPKLKWVRAELHRKPLHWWKLVYATVSRSASGKYYCSLLFEYPDRAAQPPLCAQRAIGINYSPARFYVDSNGHSPELPTQLAENTEKLARMYRALGRMEQGSRNYQQQLHRIQVLHEHIAGERRDFIHKESRRIADTYDIVCVSNPNLQKLAGTDGFGRFRDCLRYKLERQGKLYLTVSTETPDGVEGAKHVLTLGMAQLGEAPAADSPPPGE